MSDVWRFVIPGIPRGWKRPGESPFGGRHRFNPRQNEEEQDLMRLIANRVMSGRPPFEGPIDLRMTAYFPVPAGWPKAKRAAAFSGRLFHTSKPDGSNIQKLLEDAFNSGVWKDDCQVARWGGQKLYSDTPRLVVEVRPLMEPDYGVTTTKTHGRLF